MYLFKPETKLPLTQVHPRPDQKGAQNNPREIAKEHAPVNTQLLLTQIQKQLQAGQITFSYVGRLKILSRKYSKIIVSKHSSVPTLKERTEAKVSWKNKRASLSWVGSVVTFLTEHLNGHSCSCWPTASLCLQPLLDENTEQPAAFKEAAKEN